MSRIRPVLVMVLFALSLAALWLLYAPAAAGGGLRLVSVSGTSMNPLLHGGDLVFVRPTGSYAPGDVLLYRAESGATYLHRAIREEDGRLIFKGDNNSWEDSTRVRPTDVIGEMVGHVPGAGRLPGGPRFIPILAIVAAAGAALSLLRKDNGISHQRRSPAMNSGLTSGRGPSPRPASNPPSRALAAFARSPLGQGLLNGAAAAGVLATALLLFGFAGPLETSTSTTHTVKYAGSFSFAGVDTSARPAAIETNSADGPVFFRTADTLVVTYGYAVEADAPISSSSQTSLAATLRADNGWTAPLAALDSETHDGVASATFDLAQIGTLLQAFEESTGVKVGSYFVEVTATTDAAATVAGVAAGQRAAHTLTLKGDSSMLQLWDGGKGAAEALNPFDERTVDVPGTTPRTFGILGFEIRAEAARTLGLGLAAATAAALGAAALAAFEYSRRPEAAQAKALLAGKVVEVASVEPEGTVVELTSMNDLRRIAGNRPILLSSIGGRPCYLVSDGVTWYSYTPAGEAADHEAADHGRARGPEGQGEPRLEPHS
jgi:signal peptidase I